MQKKACDQPHLFFYVSCSITTFRLLFGRQLIVKRIVVHLLEAFCELFIKFLFSLLAFWYFIDFFFVSLKLLCTQLFVPLAENHVVLVLRVLRQIVFHLDSRFLACQRHLCCLVLNHFLVEVTLVNENETRRDNHRAKQFVDSSEFGDAEKEAERANHQTVLYRFSFCKLSLRIVPRNQRQPTKKKKTKVRKV